MQIQQQIEQARKKHKISMDKLAELTAIDQSNISKILRSKIQPTLPTVDLLCKTVGLELQTKDNTMGQTFTPSGWKPLEFIGKKIQHTELIPTKHGRKWACTFLMWIDKGRRIESTIWGKSESDCLTKTRKFLGYELKLVKKDEK